LPFNIFLFLLTLLIKNPELLDQLELIGCQTLPSVSHMFVLNLEVQHLTLKLLKLKLSFSQSVYIIFIHFCIIFLNHSQLLFQSF